MEWSIGAGLWETPPIEDHMFWAYHLDKWGYTVYLSREPCHGWELWVDATSQGRVGWVVRPLTEDSKGVVDTVPAPVVVPGGNDKGGTSRTEAGALEEAERHVWQVSRW